MAISLSPDGSFTVVSLQDEKPIWAGHTNLRHAAVDFSFVADGQSVYLSGNNSIWRVSLTRRRAEELVSFANPVAVLAKSAGELFVYDLESTAVRSISLEDLSEQWNMVLAPKNFLREWSCAKVVETNLLAIIHEANDEHKAKGGELWCMDTKSGRLRWKYTVRRVLSVAPTIGSDACYVIVETPHESAKGAELIALGLSDGKVLWESGEVTDAGIFEPPTYSRGMLYFENSAGTLHAIEWKTKKVLWKNKNCNHDDIPLFCGIATLGPLVLWGTCDSLVGLSETDGAIVCRIEDFGAIRLGVAMDGKVFYETPNGFAVVAFVNRPS
jgi:hypothetical protein